MVRLWMWFLWVCALYMTCSRAVVSLLGWTSGSDMDVPVHDVSVSVYEENIVFSGSSK
jgi:hypothetical protein